MASRADASSFTISWARFFVVCGVAFALTACGGGGGASSPGGAAANSLPNVAATFNTAGVTNTPIPPAVVATPQIVSPTNGSVSAPVSSAAKNTAPVPVQFTYTLPTSTAPNTQVTPNIGISIQSRTRRMLSNASYVGYTSTAAPISISITVTPIGGSALGPYTGSCTAASTGTSGTCTVTGFTAAPGPTTIAGTVTESGNTIATFSNLTIIQPSTVNSLNFTANPVVSSVAVSLGSTAVNGGTATSVPVIVTAYDANNKTIAGTQSYVDAQGNPFSLILNVSNTQAGGKGTVTLQGPSRVTAPGQAATYAYYDGNWLASASISLSSTSSLIASPTASTLMITPWVTEYAAGVTNPTGITKGPDGKLWYTSYSSGNINAMSTNGTTFGPYSCGACSNPDKITVGSDGNLWFTDLVGSHIYKSNTSGSVSLVANTAANPTGIVLGPDGNLWYSTLSGQTISKISASGKNTDYSASMSAISLAFGPDENIWYLQEGGTQVKKMSMNGIILGTYTIANDGSWSESIVTGPDGNVWFVNFGSNLVEKSDLNGNITPYSLTGSAGPREIIVGLDGSMWFTEQGTSKIGRLSTSGTGLQEWGNGSNGLSSGAGPVSITLGPDGNIWFTEQQASKIGKFVY